MSYEAAVEIVKRLGEAGRVAYLAGGCVRDRVLGLDPKDYDVATAAEPQAVLGMFRHARAVGESFGVVLVPLRQAQIEVATFREEWGYSDGRRPDGVRFTDAAHDARRRDFTI
ncbi:MAG: CCA tRNA nucleotidyltransferase, partial [Planctomycetota bacterium]